MKKVNMKKWAKEHKKEIGVVLAGGVIGGICMSIGYGKGFDDGYTVSAVHAAHLVNDGFMKFWNPKTNMETDIKTAEELAKEFYKH